MRKLIHSLILSMVDRVFRMSPVISCSPKCWMCEEDAKRHKFQTYGELYEYNNDPHYLTCQSCDDYMSECYHYSESLY